VKQWIEPATGGWKARVRFPNGRGRSKTFATQRQAKAWLRRTVTEIHDGTFIPEASGKIALADWVQHWEATTVDLAPGTRNRRASDLRNWILPEFGGRPIASITQPEVKAWVAAMTRDGANAGSVKLRYETLSTVLRAAVDADLIKRSPCYRVGLPRYDTEEMRLLTIGDIVGLAETIHPRYRALILLAGTGGLRMGELGALRGRRVDLRRGTVEVVENLALDNGTPVIGPVKTKASRRTIPLPRQTVTALDHHIGAFRVGADDFLFTSAQGQLLRAYQFRRRYFHPAAASVGLAPLRPHDLRHSAISLWIASGANPKVVQVKAGHSSIKVTYDRYGHLFPDYDDRTTRHLERLWADVETGNVVSIARSMPK
jgi:integrase